MQNQRERTASFSTGPDAFSDPFTGQGAGQLGAVDVVHGIYSHTYPLAGLTVRQARSAVERQLNIPPDATAVVNGRLAADETVLSEGQLLYFMKRAGERGAVCRSAGEASDG